MQSVTMAPTIRPMRPVARSSNSISMGFLPLRIAAEIVERAGGRGQWPIGFAIRVPPRLDLRLPFPKFKRCRDRVEAHRLVGIVSEHTGAEAVLSLMIEGCEPLPGDRAITAGSKSDDAQQHMVLRHIVLLFLFCVAAGRARVCFDTHRDDVAHAGGVLAAAVAFCVGHERPPAGGTLRLINSCLPIGMAGTTP